jgi:serine/threonine protein kinase
MSRIVENYEIQHALGEGAMGTVYFAIDIRLHREVALKCLRPEMASNPGVMARFRKELIHIQIRIQSENDFRATRELPILSP